MKYALVLRKLLYNNTLYYQVIDKVIGEETFDNKIMVVDGDKYLNQELFSIENKKSQYVYIEVDKNDYENISLNNFIYYKDLNNEIITVDDPKEYVDITIAFHDKYQDFRIIPNYNIDELTTNVKDDLKNKIIGQDKPISKVLKKIYDNQMYFESDLNYDDIYKYKSNIMLIGEMGSGKSTIVDSLINELNPIPVVCCSLTGNPTEDIAEIVKQLWIAANGNQFLAQRGIVIFDSIESMGTFNTDGDLQSYVSELETIMKSREVYLMSYKKNQDEKENNNIIKFDYSFITHICILDLDYDFKNNVSYDDIYYSKVYGKKLAELGFSLSMIDTLFDDEVIFMNEMTAELATSILKNENTSPLYKMKRTLEDRGKKVRISKDFVNCLVDYGLDFRMGFVGIIKTMKYLLESKDLSKKEIVFKSDDLFDLQVGTVDLMHDELYDDYYEETNNEVESKKKEKDTKKFDDIFKVDVKNRSINGLKVSDVVNIIKKNVKGQDEGIFYVVNAFYNHVFNRYRGYNAEELRELKENILLFGATGVGKTAIVRSLANIFKIPYVREIATRYSKAGFKGEDVDSMLYDLVEAAKGDIKKAQNGILYIDEIDKIKAEKGNHDEGMAEGVQYNLLTLIEGDKRKIEGNAMQGRESIEFDTSNLWVIGTGAFDGLDEYIKERIKKEKGLGKVGFGGNSYDLKVLPSPTDDDLHNYGFDRQFLGRFPNKVPLQNINVDILYEIINNPNGGVVTLTKRGYESDGIVISMSDNFKRALAQKAYDKKQGARGIHSAFIDIKNNIDKNIVNGDIQEVILNEDCVDDLNKIKYIKRKK